MLTMDRIGNEALMKKWSTPEGFYKGAAEMQDIVQLRMQELKGVARQVMTFRPIGPNDPGMERFETDIEGFYYRDWLAAEADCMAINFRGKPNFNYVHGHTVKYPFHALATEIVEKSETELRWYPIPFLKMIEQSQILKLLEWEDEYFMQHAKIAVFQATRTRRNILITRGEITGTGSDLNFFNNNAFMNYLFTQRATTTWTPLGTNTNRANGYFTNIILSEQEVLNKDVVVEAQQILDTRELQGSVLLITQFDFRSLGLLSEGDVGPAITGELATEGWTYKKIGGVTYITTIRDNPAIVSRGQIFIFPEEKFLGKMFILEDTKWEIDKRHGVISMWAREHIGGGFGNMNGVGLVLLKGAMIDLPVYTQDPVTAAVTANGTLRVINDPDQTTIPAIV